MSTQTLFPFFTVGRPTPEFHTGPEQEPVWSRIEYPPTDFAGAIPLPVRRVEYRRVSLALPPRQYFAYFQRGAEAEVREWFTATAWWYCHRTPTIFRFTPGGGDHAIKVSSDGVSLRGLWPSMSPREVTGMKWVLDLAVLCQEELTRRGPAGHFSFLPMSVEDRG